MLFFVLPIKEATTETILNNLLRSLLLRVEFTLSNQNKRNTIMLNRTSINKTVVSNILNACRESLSNVSGLAYVVNRSGRPFIRVKRVRTRHGVGFEIINKHNTNIGNIISNAVVGHRKGEEFCKTTAHELSTFILKRVAYSYQIV